MTYVKQQKGVSFNYLQFLWSGIGQIRTKQAEGDFGTALKLIAQLIDYLPENIKETFSKKAALIEHSMTLISSGNLPEIKKIPDLFLRIVYKHKLFRAYANLALHNFVDELSTELDQKGYMISRTDVIEGRSHTLRKRTTE